MIRYLYEHTKDYIDMGRVEIEYQLTKALMLAPTILPDNTQIVKGDKRIYFQLLKQIGDITKEPDEFEYDSIKRILLYDEKNIEPGIEVVEESSSSDSEPQDDPHSDSDQIDSYLTGDPPLVEQMKNPYKKIKPVITLERTFLPDLIKCVCSSLRFDDIDDKESFLEMTKILEDFFIRNDNKDLLKHMKETVLPIQALTKDRFLNNEYKPISVGGFGVIYESSGRIFKFPYNRRGLAATRVEKKDGVVTIEGLNRVDINDINNFIEEILLGTVLYCSVQNCLSLFASNGVHNPFLKITKFYLTTTPQEDILIPMMEMEKLEEDMRSIITTLHDEYALDATSEIVNRGCKRVVLLIYNFLGVLHYLQQQIDFIHNDLHIRNIMVDKDDNIRIIDYGMVECDLSSCNFGATKLCNGKGGENCRYPSQSNSQDVRAFLASMYSIIDFLPDLRTTIYSYFKPYYTDGNEVVVPNFRKFCRNTSDDPNFYPKAVQRLLRSLYPQMF